MLISNLPPHLRAQAEAERERQRPGNQNDDLETAFDWLKYGDEYWFNINLGNFPPPTYPAEDVEALVKALEQTLGFEKHMMTDNEKEQLRILATFKSKHPGV